MCGKKPLKVVVFALLKIHPMALLRFDELEEKKAKKEWTKR